MSVVVGRDSKSARRRWISIAALLVAATLGAAVWTAYRRNRIEPLVPQLREAGVPVTRSEFVLPASDPKGVDGLPLLEAAIADADARLGGDWSQIDSLLTVPGVERPPPLPDDLRELLTPCVERIFRAASSATFRSAAADPWGDHEPLVRSLQSAVKLLGCFAGPGSSIETRVGSVRALCRLSDRTLRNDAITLLVSWAARGAALGRTRDAVSAGDPAAAAMAAVFLEEVSPDRYADFRTIAVRELGIAATVLLEWERGESEESDPLGDVGEDWKSLVARQPWIGRASAAEGAHDALRALAVPHTDRAAWLRSWRAFGETYGRKSPPLISGLVIVGPWVARRALLAEAANDLACLAAAWLRCRDRGVLSSDVSELEREVGRGPLRDPFTGRPYVMEFSESRVVLSSQGRLDGDLLADPEDIESHHLRWEIPR